MIQTRKTYFVEGLDEPIEGLWSDAYNTGSEEVARAYAAQNSADMFTHRAAAVTVETDMPDKGQTTRVSMVIPVARIASVGIETRRS